MKGILSFCHLSNYPKGSHIGSYVETALKTYLRVSSVVATGTGIHLGPAGPTYVNVVFFHEWGPNERCGAVRTVKIHIMSMRVFFVLKFH